MYSVGLRLRRRVRRTPGPVQLNASSTGRSQTGTSVSRQANRGPVRGPFYRDRHSWRFRPQGLKKVLLCDKLIKPTRVFLYAMYIYTIKFPFYWHHKFFYF